MVKNLVESTVLEKGSERKRGIPDHSMRFDLSNYRKEGRKQGNIGEGVALECGDDQECGLILKLHIE